MRIDGFALNSAIGWSLRANCRALLVAKLSVLAVSPWSADFCLLCVAVARDRSGCAATTIACSRPPRLLLAGVGLGDARDAACGGFSRTHGSRAQLRATTSTSPPYAFAAAIFFSCTRAHTDTHRNVKILVSRAAVKPNSGHAVARPSRHPGRAPFYPQQQHF